MSTTLYRPFRLTTSYRPQGRPPGRPCASTTCRRRFPGPGPSSTCRSRSSRGTSTPWSGGNGSGKSTLIKILAGVYHADPGGTITVGDTDDRPPITPRRPRPGNWACTSCTRTRRSSRLCRWPRTWSSVTASPPTAVGLDPVAGAAPPDPGPARPVPDQRAPRGPGELPAAGRAGHGGHRPRPAGPGRAAHRGPRPRRADGVAAPGRGGPAHGCAEPVRGSRSDHLVREPPARRGDRHRRRGHGAARRASGRHPGRRPRSPRTA